MGENGRNHKIDRSQAKRADGGRGEEGVGLYHHAGADADVGLIPEADFERMVKDG